MWKISWIRNQLNLTCEELTSCLINCKVLFRKMANTLLIEINSLLNYQWLVRMPNALYIYIYIYIYIYVCVCVCVCVLFCRLASINVGKYFLKLIDKHFKHNNILHKISNRKTLKISYSCTKNIFQIINNHNEEIIKNFRTEQIIIIIIVNKTNVIVKLEIIVLWMDYVT